MSKKTKKSKKNPYQDQILKFLEQNPNQAYRRKDISRALKVDKSGYHHFRKAVTELAREGKIAHLKGGRYAALATQKAVEGLLQMTRKGFGFVADDSGGPDIFIPAQNLNTALDSDRVLVQVFRSSRGKSREGQVTTIVSRATDMFVGTYHKSQYYGFVVPDNPKVYRDFYIPEGNEMNAQNGQKVVVRLGKWESSQMNPEGEIVDILGFPDDPGVDVASVAIGHGLPLKFGHTLERQTNQMTLEITQDEVTRRLDLRDKQIFTIDPPDAKDFDDAVSLEKLPNGNYYLGVHIADVSHFVEAGSALDKEALQRGTSIYLVDRVIPMLPEHLSNQLCSLQPHEDRLSYSCFMEVDGKGKVVNYEIRESIINSKRRFTYQEVQEIIDDPKSKDGYAGILREMHDFSQFLRQCRFAEGSIDFNTPEVRFILDEKGQPVDIIPVVQLHSHQLIEEFMLLANKTVAEHVFKIAPDEKKPNPFIFRVHDKPDQEKLHKFREFMQALGYKVQIKANITPADFQAILKQIEGGTDEILIKEVALRTMMKAVYSPVNAGHFGLAFKHYTHFTSPIRRYPDLMVHRLLKEYNGDPLPFKEKRARNQQLKEVCQITSDRERRAMEAERESVRIKQVEWLVQHQDQEFEGVISGVTSFGIFVETLPYLIEGLVRVERMENDFYIFDEKTYSMIGRESGEVLRLGDPVRVRVARIDRERNEVDFEFIKA